MAGYRKCQNPQCDEMISMWSNRKYHNQNCRQRAYRLRHPNARKVTSVFERRSCKNCGKSFRTNQPQKRYCKTSCRVSHWQQMKRLEGKQ